MMKPIFLSNKAFTFKIKQSTSTQNSAFKLYCSIDTVGQIQQETGRTP